MALPKNHFIRNVSSYTVFHSFCGSVVDKHVLFYIYAVINQISFAQNVERYVKLHSMKRFCAIAEAAKEIDVHFPIALAKFPMNIKYFRVPISGKKAYLIFT